MNVILPEEVDAKNIITRKEIQVMAEALDAIINAGVDLSYMSRAKVALARSARRKLQKTLDGFGA